MDDSPLKKKSRRNWPLLPLSLSTSSQLGSAWKIWLVIGDCCLIGLQPVLVHMSKNAQGTFSFNPLSINLLVELAKTAFALSVLLVMGTGRPGAPMYLSLNAFIRDATHCRLLAIPAGLYAINNYFKFAMQLYFKPTTAKMLTNLKILVIALLMRWVLRRHFNIFQWEALFLLVAGISINQLTTCSESNKNPFKAPAAVAFTFGSITVPSLASVYNEAALKRQMETSVHLQNFFLYFYGALFNLLGTGIMLFVSRQPAGTMFHGFSKVAMLLVANNALQGILSSFFYKFADTILKKYSSTMATIFTAFVSAAAFGHKLTLNFLIGVSIVFISMHQFMAHGGLKGMAPGKNQLRARQTSFVPSPSLDNLKAESYDDLSALDSEQLTLNQRRPPLLPR
ncbi:hypothetical protein WJX74_002350 [Apatococcus lobatus]|uniref:Uncharacterized protein n=1 Tax=Apatococcus lobatus TaxID=904363 RepID=A0AAW1RUR2_9CHLO